MSSDQIKIAIVSGKSKSADSVRGIGVHNSELFKAFKNNSSKDINIPEISINDDFSKFDVVHFTVFTPFQISLPFLKPKNTKFVLTIHDMHRLIYPKQFPSGIKGALKYLINKLLIWKNVDQIITISETSKKDIVRFLRVDPNIVNVVYLGPKDAHHPIKDKKLLNLVAKKYNLPSKFVVYLGDINYNKNTPVLVEVCKKIGIQLVIIGKQAKEVKENTSGFNILIGPMDYLRSFFGKPHPEIAHYQSLKDSFNKNNVYCLGFVDDDDVNKIMNLAVCTVQPSLYEGFGLSVIHGFASGSPVIAGRTQALVEVGGDACLYFDPNDPNELAQKIKMFLDSEKLRKEYIKNGFERVKKFSWKKAAQETLEVYAKSI